MLSKWNCVLMIKQMISLKTRVYQESVVGFLGFSPEISASVCIFKIKIYSLDTAWIHF